MQRLTMPGKKKPVAKKGAARKTVRKSSAKGAAKKSAKKSAKRSVKRAATTTSAAPPGRPEARDHRVTRDHAVKMHQRHIGARRARGAKANGSVGGLFSRDAVMTLLQQPGAEYMRFYYGMHEDGTPGIVLAASDANLALVGGDDALLLDQHYLCPPFCPPADGGLT
jgi:hypothetical protein